MGLCSSKNHLRPSYGEESYECPDKNDSVKTVYINPLFAVDLKSYDNRYTGYTGYTGYTAHTAHTAHTWQWVSATHCMVEKYTTITFKTDDTFYATVANNVIWGKYKVLDNFCLTFSKIEMSQENALVDILKNTYSFYFSNNADLVLVFKDGMGTGTANFRDETLCSS